MCAQALGAYLRKTDMDCKLENIRRSLMMVVKEEVDDYAGVEEGAAQAVEGLGWEEDTGDWGEMEEQDAAEEDYVEVMEDEVEEVVSSGNEASAKKALMQGEKRYVAPWGRRAKDWVVSTDKWGGQRYNSGWYWYHNEWYPFPGW